jgi:chromosome partitioning protein
MILLVGNLKGGTGKSTIAFNLAVWAVHQQRKVLLVDADPQGTSSDLLEMRRENGHQPVVFGLSTDESRLSEDVGRVKDIFEDIIIDIAAGDRVGFKAALTIADCLLIPLLPGQSDVWAVSNVLDVLEEVGDVNPHLKVMGVINKADTRGGKETEETAEAMKELGVDLLPVTLGYRVVFRRSLPEGLGVIEWERRSQACQEIEELAASTLGQ